MDGPLQRAELTADSTGETLTFHYNPTTITVQKTAQWRRPPTRNSEQAPPAEFVGTKPSKLTMQLLFDAWDAPGRSVSDAVAMLFRWTCPTSSSRDRNTPQPPLLILHWGTQTYFRCYLSTISAQYTMFAPDGTPLRAKVDVTLDETPENAQSQNPTSGGVSGRRSVTVLAGDTLANVAYREYGDPNLWRALAEANGVDDPMRVPPGTGLLVPPRAEADALAGRRRA